jgi:uncharacterized protein YukE
VDGQLTVELADLRGWADQVGRAGGDCAYLADYVTTYVPDGDFGRILALIRPDYEHLVLVVRDSFETSGRRLGAAGDGLRHCAERYAAIDARIAHDLHPDARSHHDRRGDRRVSPHFRDRGGATPTAPVCGGEVLPEVTVGWGFAHVCDLISHWGGPDLRHELVDEVSGDIGKALAQASVWEHAAQSLSAVRGTLADGSTLVGRTWEGRAASASRDHIEEWVEALGSQSDALFLVAEHLRDAVGLAVEVAQLIADVVQQVVTAVLAGFAFASIPIYGQVHAVHRIRDVLRLLNDARKVILVFWTFLVAMKDALMAIIGCFTGQSLPDAPSALPASAA